MTITAETVLQPQAVEEPRQPSAREKLRADLARALCQQRFKRLCTEEEIAAVALQLPRGALWRTMAPQLVTVLWLSLSLGFGVAEWTGLGFWAYLVFPLPVIWILVPNTVPELRWLVTGEHLWRPGFRPRPRPLLVLGLLAVWVAVGLLELVVRGPDAVAVTHGVPVLIVLTGIMVAILAMRIRGEQSVLPSLPLGLPIAVVLLFVPLFSSELWEAASSLTVERWLLLQAITVLLLGWLLWRQLSTSVGQVFRKTAQDLARTGPGEKDETPADQLGQLIKLKLEPDMRKLVESTFRSSVAPTRATLIAARAKRSFDLQLVGRLVPVVLAIGVTAALYIYLLATLTIDVSSVEKWTSTTVPTATVDLPFGDAVFPGGVYLSMAGLLGVVATAIFIAFVMTEDRYAAALAETVMYRPVERCLLVATTYTALRTPGDEFERPIEISGPEGSQEADSTFATKAHGEPDHAGVPSGRSLWFSWTPSDRRTAMFDTKGSEFDTVLAAYTGESLTELSHLSNDDAEGGRTSRVVFPALPGTTYHVAVDGYRGGCGKVRLNWSTQPAPVNDNIGDATEIGTHSGREWGDSAFATLEPGEPRHAQKPGGKSLWYRWTAPDGKAVVFDTKGSSFDTLLAVYLAPPGREPDPHELREVASNDDAQGTTSLVTFPAEAGVEYYIAVDGYRGACGSVVLNWSTPEPPENDDVASARTIGENAGTLEDDNTYATYEPDEPPHAGAAAASRSGTPGLRPGRTPPPSTRTAAASTPCSPSTWPMTPRTPRSGRCSRSRPTTTWPPGRRRAR